MRVLEVLGLFSADRWGLFGSLFQDLGSLLGSLELLTELACEFLKMASEVTRFVPPVARSRVSKHTRSTVELGVAP